jgi:hypothetical protein
MAKLIKPVRISGCKAVKVQRLSAGQQQQGYCSVTKVSVLSTSTTGPKLGRIPAVQIAGCRWSPEEIDTILSMQNVTKNSDSATARMIGVSTTTVRRWHKKFGRTVTGIPAGTAGIVPLQPYHRPYVQLMLVAAIEQFLKTSELLLPGVYALQNVVKQVAAEVSVDPRVVMWWRILYEAAGAPCFPASSRLGLGGGKLPRISDVTETQFSESELRWLGIDKWQQGYSCAGVYRTCSSKGRVRIEVLDRSDGLVDDIWLAASRDIKLYDTPREDSFVALSRKTSSEWAHLQQERSDFYSALWQKSEKIKKMFCADLLTADGLAALQNGIVAGKIDLTHVIFQVLRVLQIGNSVVGIFLCSRVDCVKFGGPAFDQLVAVLEQFDRAEVCTLVRRFQESPRLCEGGYMASQVFNGGQLYRLLRVVIDTAQPEVPESVLEWLAICRRLGVSGTDVNHIVEHILVPGENRLQEVDGATLRLFEKGVPVNSSALGDKAGVRQRRRL